MKRELIRRGFVPLVSLALVLASCGTGGLTTAQKWCDGHLAKVAEAGTRQSTRFEFGSSRAPIEWAEFIGDSELERSVILAESQNGPDVYEAACQDAYGSRGASASPSP